MPHRLRSLTLRTLRRALALAAVAMLLLVQVTGIGQGVCATRDCRQSLVASSPKHSTACGCCCDQPTSPCPPMTCDCQDEPAALLPAPVLPNPTTLVPAFLAVIAELTWPVPESQPGSRRHRPPDPGGSLPTLIRSTILLV